MAICRLMIEDFMHGTGRYPECFNYAKAYDNGNLWEGIAYAEWLMEDGYKKEPFYKYDLNGFIKWANKKLDKNEK